MRRDAQLTRDEHPNLVEERGKMARTLARPAHRDREHYLSVSLASHSSLEWTKWTCVLAHDGAPLDAIGTE